ncbi:MAG: family 16 glycosylhydrolase [Clostridiales bacterium]|jgi:beta-glucanase (GH16 family)|nr:family 16 glycosylhydrolase [Clostridiales bacterium]
MKQKNNGRRSIVAICLLFALAFSGCMFGQSGQDQTADKDSLIDFYDEVYLTQADTYTGESWQKFIAALRGAERAIESAKATQKQVDDALSSLETAFNALKKHPSEEGRDAKKSLADFFATVCRESEEEYTQESWLLFEEALRTAAVFIESTETTQAQAAYMLAVLQDAHAALERRADVPIEGLLDPAKYTLTFSDEFYGTALDTDKWDIQRGNGSAYDLWKWGNEEEQSYKEENLEVSGGTLKITAQSERHDGREYTSGRIRTYGKFSQTYGRFEARIRMPAVTGLWPAFWMLADANNWPYTGEIDIMEARGRVPYTFTGAIHFQHVYGVPYCIETESISVPAGIAEFNVYALEWRPGRLDWLLNGEAVDSVTRWDSDRGGIAPFDKPFHMLLNLAVGGNFDGMKIPAAADLPAVMEVDYVRAYSFVP